MTRHGRILAISSVSRQPHDYETRVPLQQDRLGIQADLFEDARSERVDQDIGFVDKGEEDREGRGILEVEGYRRFT